MRVPDSLRSWALTNQLSGVTERLNVLQTEVSSGIRIHVPSDDPGGAVRASNLRTGLAQVEQFQQAVGDSSVWLKSEDSALNSLQGQLNQVRTITLQGANTLPSNVRETLANQIASLKESIVQTANSSDGTRFLFAGYQTKSTPFAMAAGVVSYSGDDGVKAVAIGEGVTLQVNHTGEEVFNMGSAAEADLPDLFETLTALESSIRSGNNVNMQAGLHDLDRHIARISSVRAETGIRLSQINISTDQLEQSNLTLKSFLAETEGSDLSLALVQLKEQENLFQAATYVASTIGQRGLLQWLQ